MILKVSLDDKVTETFHVYDRYSLSILQEFVVYYLSSLNKKITIEKEENDVFE